MPPRAWLWVFSTVQASFVFSHLISYSCLFSLWSSSSHPKTFKWEKIVGAEKSTAATLKILRVILQQWKWKRVQKSGDIFSHWVLKVFNGIVNFWWQTRGCDQKILLQVEVAASPEDSYGKDSMKGLSLYAYQILHHSYGSYEQKQTKCQTRKQTQKAKNCKQTKWLSRTDSRALVDAAQRTSLPEQGASMMRPAKILWDRGLGGKLSNTLPLQTWILYRSGDTLDGKLISKLIKCTLGAVHMLSW